MDCPEPGLHKGVPASTYRAWEAANQSTLKLFKRSAAHARESIIHPTEQTPAQALGDATHVAILEPERFERDYAETIKVDRRTKEGKAAWALFEAEHSGQEILPPADYTLCRAMAKAAWAHPTAIELLKGTGANELCAVWDDPHTGVRCKLRADRYTDFAGYGTVVDVKTTRDASPGAFSRDCANFGYALQGGFYLDGLDAIQPADRRFILLAIEKTPPYCVACYELDMGSLEQGRREYGAYLEAFKAARESGDWPAYPIGVQDLSLPAWAFKEIDDGR